MRCIADAIGMPDRWSATMQFHSNRISVLIPEARVYRAQRPCDWSKPAIIGVPKRKCLQSTTKCGGALAASTATSPKTVPGSERRMQDGHGRVAHAAYINDIRSETIPEAKRYRKQPVYATCIPCADSPAAPDSSGITPGAKII